jgi:hypothetical protein
MADPKYLARELAQVQRGPGIWNGVKVGIFRVQDGREEQIGEYSRNYGTNFSCFHPFRRNGADFALYSPDYTVTRVLELPSCRDLGGEEPDGGGFCPVDFHIPSFIRQEYRSGQLPEPFVQTIWQPKDSDLEPKTLRTPDAEGKEVVSTYRPLTPLTYVPYGFVAGCYWGDDSSWKIQYLDLSQAHRGIVKRDERFGYIVLPDSLSLAEAVQVGGDDSEDPYLHLSIRETFRLSGKRPADEA